MKIKIHFKGNNVPNILYNKFSQRPAKVNASDINNGALFITDIDGLTIINMSIVAAVEVTE